MVAIAYSPHKSTVHTPPSIPVGVKQPNPVAVVVTAGSKAKAQPQQKIVISPKVTEKQIIQSLKGGKSIDTAKKILAVNSIQPGQTSKARIVSLKKVSDTSIITGQDMRSSSQQLLSQESNPVYSFFHNAYTDVTDVGKHVQTSVAQAINDGLMAKENKSSQIVSGIDNVVSKIRGGAANVFGQAVSQYNTSRKVLQASVETAKNVTSKIGGSIGSDIMNGIHSVETKLDSIGSTISKGATNASSSVYNELKTSYQEGANAIVNVTNKVYNAIKKLPQDLTKLGGQILSALKTLWSDFVKFGQWMETTIMNGLKLLEQDFMKGMDWLWHNIEQDVGKYIIPPLEDIGFILGALALIYLAVRS